MENYIPGDEWALPEGRAAVLLPRYYRQVAKSSKSAREHKTSEWCVWNQEDDAMHHGDRRDTKGQSIGIGVYGPS